MSKSKNKPSRTAGQQAAAEQQGTAGEPDVVTEPTAPMPEPEEISDEERLKRTRSVLESIVGQPIEITYVTPALPRRIVAIQFIDSSGLPDMDVPRYVIGATTTLADSARVPVKFTESGNDIIVEWQDGPLTKFKNVPMELEYEKV